MRNRVVLRCKRNKKGVRIERRISCWAKIDLGRAFSIINREAQVRKSLPETAFWKRGEQERREEERKVKRRGEDLRKEERCH